MAESDSVPYLKRLSDNREYHLEGSSVVIGRRDTCEIVLSDESGVSRQHAVITVVEDDLTIEDLGSTNGVLLNGVKITAPTKINADDTLIFDILEYQLKTPQVVQEAAAQEAAAQEAAAQEAAAQEAAAQEEAAQEEAAQEESRTGQSRTGQSRTGESRTGESRTGESRWFSRALRCFWRKPTNGAEQG